MPTSGLVNSPTPNPPRTAAPRAAPGDASVVCTPMPNASAMIWRQSALCRPPPAPRATSAAAPARCINSRPWRWLKATPSSTARTRCSRRWPRCRPKNTPRASGSTYGVRSPLRYGKNTRPSQPGGASPARSISQAYAPSPVTGNSGCSRSRSQRREPPALSVTDIRCQRSGSA